LDADAEEQAAKTKTVGEMKSVAYPGRRGEALRK
jgi:hypothetical protein